MTGLLTVDQAAELVDVTTRTVRRWLASGALSPFAMQGERPLLLATEVEARAAIARKCRGPVS